MKTLGVAVQNNPNGSKEVVAREVNNDCTAVHGGNGDIECDPGEDIYWKNCGDDWKGGGSHTFLVTFEKKNSDSKWPFKSPTKPPDATLTVSPSTGAGVQTTLRNSVFRQKWKYAVEVKNNNFISKLDPMIIIRRASTLTMVALAVGAAILVVAAIYFIREFGPG